MTVFNAEFTVSYFYFTFLQLLVRVTDSTAASHFGALRIIP